MLIYVVIILLYMKSCSIYDHCRRKVRFCKVYRKYLPFFISVFTFYEMLITYSRRAGIGIHGVDLFTDIRLIAVSQARRRSGGTAGKQCIFRPFSLFWRLLHPTTQQLCTIITPNWQIKGLNDYAATTVSDCHTRKHSGGTAFCLH